MATPGCLAGGWKSLSGLRRAQAIPRPSLTVFTAGEGVAEPQMWLSPRGGCAELFHKPQLLQSKPAPPGDCEGQPCGRLLESWLAKPAWMRKDIFKHAEPVFTACDLQHSKRSRSECFSCCSRYLCHCVTCQSHSRTDLSVSEKCSQSGGNCGTPEASSSAKCCETLGLAWSLRKSLLFSTSSIFSLR